MGHRSAGILKGQDLHPVASKIRAGGVLRLDPGRRRQNILVLLTRLHVSLLLTTVVGAGADEPIQGCRMSKRELPTLSEGQLEIVNIVWDHGEVTVGDVWRAMTKRRPVARNTISTMITRLEEKGWLRQRIEAGIYHYSVVCPREKVLPRLVRRLVDVAFQGSAEGLVLSLLEDGRLSSDEIGRIKALLDRADGETTEPKK